MQKRNYSLTLKILLLFAALLFVFIAAEAFLALRGIQPQQRESKEPATHRVVEESHVYEMIPGMNEANALGFRGPVISSDKPEGTFRILVLGDSVSFGYAVKPEEAFPALLEEKLQDLFPEKTIEVVNAGVMGYTTYNEVEWLRNRGMALDPDLVLLSFCLNDVVNPRTHWNYTYSRIVDVPREAIPNKKDDVSRVLPHVNKMESYKTSSLRRTRLGTLILDRLATKRASRFIPDFEKNPPTYITYEDPISITVYDDLSTPEMQWLKGQFENFRSLIEDAEIKSGVLLFPLSYQLNEDYPYMPLDQVEKIAEDLELPTCNVLNDLSGKDPADYYFLEEYGFNDIWHFHQEGHVYIADLLAEWLVESELVSDTGLEGER